jgi:hypothetical protein
MKESEVLNYLQSPKNEAAAKKGQGSRVLIIDRFRHRVKKKEKIPFVFSTENHGYS